LSFRRLNVTATDSSLILVASNLFELVSLLEHSFVAIFQGDVALVIDVGQAICQNAIRLRMRRSL
jgi:3D (Asp-Asp-Asp) domain-containing protein